MKHLIVGDNHGFHHNLRKFLLDQKVIDKKGAAINRDEFKVYCTGDLIDGDINKAGDILNLKFLPEWFDAVCIGNHEYAWFGGRKIDARRKHDRETLNLLLECMDNELLVPSTVVNGNLLTHAGFSSEFDFRTAEDANEFIHRMWDAAPEIGGTIAIFDWKNNGDYSTTYGDPTSGIFNLAWKKERNKHFGQIMGHTIFYTGPIKHEYDNGIVHWNIDTGGKAGKCMGGIIVDDETNLVTPVFWGERNISNDVKTKNLAPLEGEIPNYYSPNKLIGSTLGDIAEGETGKKTLLLNDLKLGMSLIAKTGTVYRVTAINRGTQEVSLKNTANGAILWKDMNSDWWLECREFTPKNTNKKLKPLKLAPKSDAVLEILEDSEIITAFRNQVNLSSA